MSIPNDNVRVIRLSNVIGDDFASGNFLFSLIHEAVEFKEIKLKQSPFIERDYIALTSVIKMIEKIALLGNERVYNVASGINISNVEILKEISRITDCDVIMDKENEDYTFPVIENKKIINEFSFQPETILNNIENLIKVYQNKYKNDTN